MIIADTSALLAFFVEAERRHPDVVEAVALSSERLVVSPYVVAELDYLLAERRGVEAELTALRELAGGAYELATLEAADLGRAADLVETYRDQSIGLTDASLVVLADRYRSKTILTLDHRHFDVLRPLAGGRFKLLPGRPTVRRRPRA